MSDYTLIKTPGVYVEEKTVSPDSVSGVSTAVPAFIGYTETAGVNGDLFYKPAKIRTLKDYERLFGTRTETITVDAKSSSGIVIDIKPPARHMYYSMQMFFDNGGESCYIVALDEKETGKTETEKFQTAIDALEFEDEPTLLVLVDAVNMETVSYYSLCQRVLAQCGIMKDRFAILDVKQQGTTENDITAFRANIGTKDLKYGAAYYPYLQTALKYQYNEGLIDVTYLDADNTETTQKLSDPEIKNAQTQLYNNIKNEIKKFSVILPPSAAIAGAYASVDRDRGVWKAPANVGLASVTGPTRKLTESENDGLNVDEETGKSINAIRSFSDKGTLIWGARTLAGNDNEWRYVPVRRLFNYVEESIKKATSFAVFEPNNAMTWLKLRSMIESFLDSLWRQGALAGGKPEDAFFVQVGLGTTMTSQDILEGRLIIKVGLAAVRPAEFIILEFTHKLVES
jgi:phage tail sheath protein FI